MLYEGTFVTIMFPAFAAVVSTILYPVARTPIYLRLGKLFKVSSVIGVLFVIITSASSDHSIILSAGVLSCRTTSWGVKALSQLRSTGV